jgi:putative endonuclease
MRALRSLQSEGWAYAGGQLSCYAGGVFHVYLLRDEAGRYYIGMTADLRARLEQHRSGGTQTTRRMTGQLELVAARAFATKHEAAVTERKLKSWKNPTKVQVFLNGNGE